MVQRAKLAAIIKNTDLPLAAKRRQTEVINKLSLPNNQGLKTNSKLIPEGHFMQVERERVR